VKEGRKEEGRDERGKGDEGRKRRGERSEEGKGEGGVMENLQPNLILCGWVGGGRGGVGCFRCL
jgi:hypothetical protein